MIEGVLFDLDDTLFDQRQWLTGAWHAVAQAAADRVDEDQLFGALVAIGGEGSAKGRIIDRALERLGAPPSLVIELVEVFREYRAVRLLPYPGVPAALAELHSMVPIGLVTDGDPGGQRSKLQALGLDDLLDVIVCSDELGREQRKPHPAPFRLALDRLAVSPDRAVHVGDHPVKDVGGAVRLGLRAVRVLTGEYRHLPCEQAAWFVAPTASDACRSILRKIFECPI